MRGLLFWEAGRGLRDREQGINRVENKDQHFVPASYLSAWTDPDTPEGHEPYVWVFKRTEKQGKRKAPKNILYEPDFYTRLSESGERDLSLERYLCQLEGEFGNIRRKLSLKDPISPRETVALCEFCAAMHGRTQVQRDHRKKQWSRVLDEMDNLAEWAKTADLEQARTFEGIGSDSEEDQGMSLEDVRQIVQSPAQTLLPQVVEIVTPVFLKMSMAVFCSEGGRDFLTSDNPCVWIDPGCQNLPAAYRSPGLCSRTIEVYMPLSPRQALCLNWQDVTGFIEVPIQAVDEINRIVRSRCKEVFIARKDEVRL